MHRRYQGSPGDALLLPRLCRARHPRWYPQGTFALLAGLPTRANAPYAQGVINVITTKSFTKEVGLELCTNTTVRKISFTGSTGVGRLLMGQASSTIKKCSFELGGLAPFIGPSPLPLAPALADPKSPVFADADLELAAAGAVAAKFRASGQTCVCTQYHLVHSSVYDKFAALLVEKVKAFKVGNGFGEGITHGPLIHEAAVEKVQRHVEDAVKNGARVLVGGKRAVVAGGEKGSFFEPTSELLRSLFLLLVLIPRIAVLVDVKSCAIDQEETFGSSLPSPSLRSHLILFFPGPIAALYKFETEEEAIAMANNCEVGLAVRSPRSPPPPHPRSSATRRDTFSRRTSRPSGALLRPSRSEWSASTLVRSVRRSCLSEE